MNLVVTGIGLGLGTKL